jgi:hypothetical protein
MSSISANKWFVLSFGPKLQLHLQVNNSKKLKLLRNLMLHKKMGFKKKRLQNKKGQSMFNIRSLEHSIPMWIEQFPSFIFSQLSTCELTTCVVALFFSIDKVLHLIWMDVCCFHFVSTKSKINSPYQVPTCENFEMQMLPCTLNPLQMMCIQIQIYPWWKIPCFSSWKLIEDHRKCNS